MTVRAGVFLIFAFASSAASAQFAPPVSPANTVSANPQATSASYGDWLLICQRGETGQQKLCEISQTIQVVQGQAGPLAQFAVSKAVAPATGLRLVVVLPNNITLANSPRLAADEKDSQPIDVGWIRCLPGGCFAEAPLRDDVVRRWRALSNRGAVTFKDGQGHDVSVPFSFRGLGPALDALSKEF